MSKLAENLPVSVTTGFRPLAAVQPSEIGERLSAIGYGKPLTASAGLADLRPADTDHRLQVCLERISGRPPALLTRTLFPNDGPSYQVVAEVRWDCPREKLPEIVKALEGAFKSAPEDRIAAQLFKLRMLTRAREQRTEEMIEAEAVIWIEQLRTYPGDIVLDVLKTWTSRSNGQWWPTWNEVEGELKRRCDRRQALLNFVRILAERPEPVKAITDRPPTYEQRAAGVAHWKEMRKGFGSEELRAPEEAPEEALKRLMAKKDAPITVGGELATKIEEIKAGA